jgi:type IV pilus assembly protein PilN
VILINLLPHREAKRRQRKQAFFAGLAAARWWAWSSRRVVPGAAAADVQPAGAQQFLKDEIAGWTVQIKDIASLRAEIDALKARQKAVEDPCSTSR